MKTEIINQEPERRVPEVGQPFCVGTENGIWVRFSDHMATKIFGDMDGWVAAFPLANPVSPTAFRISNCTFTILQPVGGVAKFERVK